MKMFKIIRKVREEEEGAVTVDWVVLTAAVVGLGAAALGLIRGSVGTLSQDIADQIAGVEADAGPDSTDTTTDPNL